MRDVQFIVGSPLLLTQQDQAADASHNRARRCSSSAGRGSDHQRGTNHSGCDYDRASIDQVVSKCLPAWPTPHGHVAADLVAIEIIAPGTAAIVLYSNDLRAA